MRPQISETSGGQPDAAAEARFRYRRLMGRFATGVTIITGVDGDRVHGMTANGFMSVSLDPPLVLISIGCHSHMHSVLTDTDRYGVSVLAEHQDDISAHFAGRPLDQLPDFVWSDDVPFVAGALGHIGSEIVDRHPAGDHTLFIGRVLHLADFTGRPLLFHGGRYDQLTAISEPHVLDGLGRAFPINPHTNR
jgi:flavin reductase (DIM6/NTAB) family NADH-FMN oxidoreductase RutF